MNARALSFALALMLLATIAFAQTRKIGHRSHSGSPATFAMVMDDDHLGGPIKMPLAPLRLPVYTVDPFIKRIRRHYEAIAKLPASVEIPPAESPKSENATTPTPSQSKPDSPKPAPAPKTAIPKTSIPQLAVVPAPDFLVKAQAKPIAEANKAIENQESSFWMLIVLLGIPIAPVVFVASAIWSRQDKRA